jgi:serine/threonine protein kinase
MAELQPDWEHQGYRDFKLLNEGMMAFSYAARDPSGRKVFLKQYISPSIRVPWFEGFKKYQQEIKSKVEANRVKVFCYEWIDQFVWKFKGRCFYQTFEFIEANTDMSKELAKGHDISFANRILMAKVMMNAIDALHDAGIVHADLKPDNILLIPNDNPAFDAQYFPKLIDMDFSLQADKRAPWHGINGYTGTPGYFSPEHLTAGGVPESASDVFTCGLILCELLCENHPLIELAMDQDAYRDAINARQVSCPPLRGKMEDLDEPANSEALINIINWCFHPEPQKRPKAKDINEVMNGIVLEWPAFGGGAVPVKPKKTDKPTKLIVPDKPLEPSDDRVRGKLVLVSESGQRLSMNVSTNLGKNNCQAFGEEARFLDSKQMTLEG